MRTGAYAYAPLRPSEHEVRPDVEERKGDFCQWEKKRKRERTAKRPKHSRLQRRTPDQLTKDNRRTSVSRVRVEEGERGRERERMHERRGKKI